MRISLVSIKKSGIELIDDDRHIERGGKTGDLADFPFGIYGAGRIVWFREQNTRAPASNAALSFARSVMPSRMAACGAAATHRSLLAVRLWV
jgi:hypothetical protein